jgi:hypothetical protein
LIVAGCIVLGWLVTSSLGPSEPYLESEGDAAVYDANSGGVLGDPSGFGQPKSDIVLAEEEDWEDESNPSVTGALSDLHHAVTDKMQSWNPYRKPETTPANKTGANKA